MLQLKKVNVKKNPRKTLKDQKAKEIKTKFEHYKKFWMLESKTKQKVTKELPNSIYL